MFFVSYFCNECARRATCTRNEKDVYGGCNHGVFNTDPDPQPAQVQDDVLDRLYEVGEAVHLLYTAYEEYKEVRDMPLQARHACYNEWVCNVLDRLHDARENFARVMQDIKIDVD